MVLPFWLELIVVGINLLLLPYLGLILVTATAAFPSVGCPPNRIRRGPDSWS